MMCHVIITGGTGVLGVALIRSLLKKKIIVTALVRKNTKRIKYLPEDKNLVIVECDLAQLSTASSWMKEGSYNAFFHLGWDACSLAVDKEHWNDMHLQNKNIGYVLDAVELCHKIACPLFIGAGSQAEYGYYSEPVTENSSVSPVTGYGAAKLCACKMSGIMCEKYGIRHVWTRLFSVYGPYDSGESLIGSSIFKLLRGDSPQYTEGSQIWDYLYSFDAAEALFLLMEYGKDREIYCVANGNSQCLREYLNLVHAIVNPNISPQFGSVPLKKKQVMYMAADISKLQKETGFSPKFSFGEGIAAMLDWAKDEL